jgi:hypothetical protein
MSLRIHKEDSLHGDVGLGEGNATEVLVTPHLEDVRMSPLTDATLQTPALTLETLAAPHDCCFY